MSSDGLVSTLSQRWYAGEGVSRLARGANFRIKVRKLVGDALHVDLITPEGETLAVVDDARLNQLRSAFQRVFDVEGLSVVVWDLTNIREVPTDVYFRCERRTIPKIEEGSSRVEVSVNGVEYLEMDEEEQGAVHLIEGTSKILNSLHKMIPGSSFDGEGRLRVQAFREILTPDSYFLRLREVLNSMASEEDLLKVCKLPCEEVKMVNEDIFCAPKIGPVPKEALELVRRYHAVQPPQNLRAFVFYAADVPAAQKWAPEKLRTLSVIPSRAQTALRNVLNSVEDFIPTGDFLRRLAAVYANNLERLNQALSDLKDPSLPKERDPYMLAAGFALSRLSNIEFQGDGASVKTRPKSLDTQLLGKGKE